MKILNVGYTDKCALFAIEGYPKTTFSIELNDKKDKAAVIEELKKRLAKQTEIEPEKQKYKDFKLKEMKGEKV